MHGGHAIAVVVPIEVKGPMREVVLARWPVVQHDSFAAVGTTPGMLLLIFWNSWNRSTWGWLG